MINIMEIDPILRAKIHHVLQQSPGSNPQSSCWPCLAISPILGCTLSKVVAASLSYAKHQHPGMMQSHSQLARQTPNPQGHRHLVGPTTGTLPQTSRHFRPRWLHVLGPVISFDQPCLLVMVADVSSHFWPIKQVYWIVNCRQTFDEF